MSFGFELVFCLEEPSFKNMLEGVMPRLAPGVSFRCFVFQGKGDLQSKLERRIAYYQNPDALFVVVQDQDKGDCRTLKAQLQDICRRASRPDTLVRIVCHELESWYLADLQAVEAALPAMAGKLAKHQLSARNRAPDALLKPSHELDKLTKGLYQKVGGSRAIGPHLRLDNDRSPSFQAFVSGVQRLVSLAEQ